jgi:hypothetical protein
MRFPCFTGTLLEPLMGDGMFRHFCPIFPGKLIANVNMTAERGNRLITDCTISWIRTAFHVQT